jgi:hypothetical protein
VTPAEIASLALTATIAGLGGLAVTVRAIWHLVQDVRDNTRATTTLTSMVSKIELRVEQLERRRRG